MLHSFYKIVHYARRCVLLRAFLRLRGSCRASVWVTSGSFCRRWSRGLLFLSGVAPASLGRAPRFGRGGGSRGGCRRSAPGVGRGGSVFIIIFRSARVAGRRGSHNHNKGDDSYKPRQIDYTGAGRHDLPQITGEKQTYIRTGT